MSKATPLKWCPVWEGRQKPQPRFSQGKGHARAWGVRHNPPPPQQRSPVPSWLAGATCLNDRGHMAKDYQLMAHKIMSNN